MFVHGREHLKEHITRRPPLTPIMDITGSVLAQRNRALVGGDYDSYHAQTARRVHAIRKRLGVTTRRGQKFTPKAAVTAADIAKNSE
jgi:signal recognition particle subunit SRP68